MLKGTTRLFYTWFNTAFLPASGCYTLTRAQLDKPAKTLPMELSVTVRYVDMQPTAEEEDASAASLQRQKGQQQEIKQHKQSASWLHDFQDPPLETSGRAGKGPGQPQGGKGAKQLQGQAVSLLAEAAVRADDDLVSTFSQPSVADACHTCIARADADVTDCAPKSGNAGCASCAPVVSSSAPASPQGRKLRSSGSWRQHLPAISSISTSALLWGSGAAGEGAGAQQRKSPKRDSWPGWDWETLAAAEDEVGWTLGCGPSPAAAAGPVPPAALYAGSQDAAAASRSRAVLRAAAHPQQQGRSGINSSNRPRVAQEARGSSAGNSRVASGLVSSQPSIELPVIVKRPSGVDSLVDALLDPEHSAFSQTSNAAAAAAAAAVSGKVLASEASSSGVGGHSTAAGYKPPTQLRKGYSWHGHSWFTAAAGSTGGAKQGSSSQPWPGLQQRGGLYDDPPALAEVAASVLDLDSLLLSERSGEVPGSVLSSCDPLQVGVAPFLSYDLVVPCPAGSVQIDSSANQTCISSRGLAQHPGSFNAPAQPVCLNCLHVLSCRACLRHSTGEQTWSATKALSSTASGAAACLPAGAAPAANPAAHGAQAVCCQQSCPAHSCSQQGQHPSALVCQTDQDVLSAWTKMCWLQHSWLQDTGDIHWAARLRLRHQAGRYRPARARPAQAAPWGAAAAGGPGSGGRMCAGCWTSRTGQRMMRKGLTVGTQQPIMLRWLPARVLLQQARRPAACRGEAARLRQGWVRGGLWDLAGAPLTMLQQMQTSLLHRSLLPTATVPVLPKLAQLQLLLVLLVGAAVAGVALALSAAASRATAAGSCRVLAVRRLAMSRCLACCRLRVQ